MLNEIKEKAEEFLNFINNDLPEGMELEFEGFYNRGFFVTKKRYALIENDNIVVKGLELVRRDWAPIAKKTQEKVLFAILKDGSPEKAIEIVKAVVQDIKKGNVKLEDLVIHTQLTKNPDEYVQKAPHVLAAQKAIKRGRKIERGSIIRYVVVKGKEAISKRAEPIEDVDIANYDPSYYIDNQLLPAVSRILDALGYSNDEIAHGEKQSSLDAFF
ncbi:MAG: DNA polymerase domain-containing protein [Methanobacteriaceae archaeon]|nr:DNA polymerase domain-containing protein [Methanobacteriaceae archaeon]